MKLIDVVICGCLQATLNNLLNCRPFREIGPGRKGPAATDRGEGRRCFFLAQKIGSKLARNYVIDAADLGLKDGNISERTEKKIKDAVKRVVEEYGEALKKLGRPRFSFI